MPSSTYAPKRSLQVGETMPGSPASSLPVRAIWSRRLTVLGALIMPVAAQAAPFCIQSQGLPAQCIYYDAGDCQREANRQGAICTASPDEVTLSTNLGQYCLV